MAAVRASSGLAYPERFYAAASYAGFGGSPDSSAPAAGVSRFQNDLAPFLNLEPGIPWSRANGQGWFCIIVLFKYKTELEPAAASASGNGSSLPKTKTVSAENGLLLETQEKDVITEGIGTVGIFDQWVAPSVSAQRPKPRYAVFNPFFN
ncbi:hypothetical protein BHE74_00024801 [Ensete ventricosum]|uniref:Uncharacterized protein n=1 Tax=Ensete ventricosum TaxID=4639 RepID=A0A444GJZ6_ENSVE|nr:hypothetical protein B296_00023415 [Ensete ventricosum]RWW35187.1 hypothetical protein GW17_00000018 [Ensete ventricosum]RWW67730.1 hypothetical protein BHE74_00024801 [Ensete ventricosum]